MRKEGLVFWATFLVTRGGAVLRKECHNCIFKSRTRVSDTSVHMDYYIALFTKSRDGHKVCWDSQKQAARQVFTISDSFQNTITYVMQLYSGLLQSDWWSQIRDQPHPMWQEMLLRTPDPLRTCKRVWAQDYTHTIMQPHPQSVTPTGTELEQPSLIPSPPWVIHRQRKWRLVNGLTTSHLPVH